MRLKLAIFAAVISLAWAGSASAEVLMMPGHLIKTPDRTTVYVIGEDFQRHVFPDEKTYFTWYPDFSSVHTVSNALMAQIPLGRNMTRKPGIRLVKIQSDPRVYFVDVGAVLRWVPTEADARAYFGPNWSKLVEDIPDGFFVDYVLGVPVTDGSVTAAPAAAAGSATSTSAEASADRSSAITPVSELNLKTPTGRPGTLAVALGEVPLVTVTLGTRDAALANFNLVAPSDSAAVVQSLRLVGYIDAGEGNPDFQPGYDLDFKGTTESLSGVVPSVWLANPTTGAVVAGPATMPTDGVMNFSNSNWRIEAGTTSKISLRSDLSSTYDFGVNPDRIAFDVVGLTAAKPDGTALNLAGLNPNGGASPLRATTVKRFGRAELSWRGGVGDVLAGHENLFGTLDVKAVDEPFRIDKLSFQTRGRYDSIQSYRLEWPGADGAPRSATASYQPGATFDGLGIRLERGTTLTFRLYGKLYGSDKAHREEEIVVDFSATAPLGLTSLATGDVIDENADGDHLKIEHRVSDFLVRFTTLTARLDSTTPTTIGRAQQTATFRFSLKAGDDGPVRLRHLAFLIKPGDTETSGPDNDLLERWADVIGNGGRATAVATLRSSDDGYVTRLVQDLPGWVSYAIYRADSRLTAPQGVNTVKNDAGVFDYTWTDDQAPVLAAGETRTFLLQLDTSYYIGGGRTMSVKLLGGHNFEWLDTTVGWPGSTVDGTNVSGLPLQGPNVYVQ